MHRPNYVSEVKAMRMNALKRTLAAGRCARGVVLDFNNAELVEMLGYLGFDFVYIDGQHAGPTVEIARHLIRAADLSDMTSIVRVPRNDPSIILEYLDAGAGGIIVPNVATPGDIDAAVEAMRYPPDGRRGGHAGSRAARFGVTQSPAEYFRRMNDEVLCIPLIEDAAALPHVEYLCGAPGVDVVAIGPSDLALSMGVVGGWDEPDVQAAVDRIRATATGAGRPVLGAARSASDAARLLEQGFGAIVISVAALLSTSARDFLAATQQR